MSGELNREQSNTQRRTKSRAINHTETNGHDNCAAREVLMRSFCIQQIKGERTPRKAAASSQHQNHLCPTRVCSVSPRSCSSPVITVAATDNTNQISLLSNQPPNYERWTAGTRRGSKWTYSWPKQTAAADAMDTDRELVGARSRLRCLWLGVRRMRAGLKWYDWNSHPLQFL